jgi:hypothetical protein
VDLPTTSFFLKAKSEGRRVIDERSSCAHLFYDRQHRHEEILLLFPSLSVIGRVELVVGGSVSVATPCLYWLFGKMRVQNIPLLDCGEAKTHLVSGGLGGFQ